MKLTRRDAEMRRQAVVRYWMANPDATGKEVQQALVSGRLTGAKSPSMSEGSIYALKAHALELLKAGQRIPPVPASAASAAASEDWKKHAKALQLALGRTADIVRVLVSREKVEVERATTTKETL